MEIEQQVKTFIESNKIIMVNDNNDLTKAMACIKGIKGMQNKVKESYDPIIDKAHASHKEAISQRDRWLKPLLDIEKKFKDAILVFNKRMQEEQNERIRKANEEMANKAEEEKQRLLSQAKATEDAWDKDELQEKAQSIVPIICEAPKKAIDQDGLIIRKTWKAKVIDINLVPKLYLIIEADMQALNKYAREYREITLPGVEFYEESSVASR